MERTQQQEAIVREAVKGGHLKVQAFAGTGKTTTLREIAQEMPDTRFIYLAFNRATADEAKEKMPRNVEARTAHSLAYRATVNKVFDKERLGNGIMALVQEIEGGKIAGGLMRIAGDDARAAAFLAVRTLVKFCQSADERPKPAHVPVEVAHKLRGNKQDQRAALSKIAKAAGALWNAVCEQDSTLPITHDFYLKYWALTQPDLGCGAVMFDEAQDANPVLLKLVMDQQCQQIYVGDSHQQIYAFRGAVDAMKEAPGDSLPLTKSWRFGPQIAAEANHVLRLLGETVPLEGGGAEGVVRDDFTNTADSILCRGNSGIIRETVEALDDGKRVAVAGGTSEAVKLMNAAYDLFCNQRPAHPELSVFTNWEEFEDFAETDEGSAYGSVVKMVLRYRGGIPHLCRRLRYDTVPEEQAELIVSTAHKAKGREWDKISFSEDFPDLYEEVTDQEGAVVSRELKREEANLLYVSITRAMKEARLCGLQLKIRETLEALLGEQVELPRDEDSGRAENDAKSPAEPQLVGAGGWFDL